MDKLKVANLIPDTLYLHGERGNILALERYSFQGGIQLEISRIDFADDFNPLDYDIILASPGSCESFAEVVKFLMPRKNLFKEFIDSGRILLTTGTSIALFGNKLMREKGDEIEGIGLIDIECKEREIPYGDDIYFKAVYNDREMEIIGNQIQMVDVIIRDEKPFGRLKYGYGNNGRDKEEGVIKGNSIFTNTLGPLLVLNPKLTVEILRVSAENKGIKLKEDFDWELEEKSFALKPEFILNKETYLTNHR